MRAFAWLFRSAARVARVEIVAIVATLAACQLDYRHTTYRCDDDKGCPDDQTCVAGRCRRGEVPTSTIECMGVTCQTPGEQCCLDFINEPRCIPAGDTCDGTTALCDGRADCATGDTCCTGEVTACFETCEAAVACTSDADCPSTAPHCCDAPITPWGTCQTTPC